MKQISALCSLVILCLVLSLPAPALAGEEKGNILLLYKEREANGKTNAHYISTFISPEGWHCEMRDVEELLDDPKADLSGYRAIVTCYLTSQMKGGDRYPDFLVRQLSEGRKVVIIGSYGAYQGLLPASDGRLVEWNISTKVINTFFWPFGLRFRFGWTGNRSVIEVTKKDPPMVEYEAPLAPADAAYYQYFSSINQQNRVYLGLRRKDLRNSDSAVVVRTPYGGMILESYGFFWDSEKRKMVQRVDMRRFIREAVEGNCPAVVPQFKVVTHEQLEKDCPLPPLSAPKERVYSGELKRKVLVLYRKSEVKRIEEHPLFRSSGIVLNYLGMIPEYRPIEKGLPDASAMEPYRGIITWFGNHVMENAAAYGDWMIHQIQSGKRIAVLGDYGAFIDRAQQLPPANLKSVFRAFGLDVDEYTGVAANEEPYISYLDRQTMNFEHIAKAEELDYGAAYRSSAPANKVYLSIQDPSAGRIDPVVITSCGGFAFDNCGFYVPRSDRSRIREIKRALRGEIQANYLKVTSRDAWIVNPYIFFAKALDIENVPVPDYTTVNGSRIFYSHIDGDAFPSISSIDNVHLASDFIIDDIFAAYQDIPFTASVITHEMEDGGTEYFNPMVLRAREMYLLPNIEAATHSTDHYFDWVNGDPYVENPGGYPWKIALQKPDLAREIWVSRLFMDRNLLLPGRRCTTILWSGACNPGRDALEVAQRSDLRNLNGGDPVFDSENSSLSNLCPVGIEKDGPYQFLSMGSNDYIYTFFFLGDWGGQKKLIEHFERTESPHRIMPMNLYFHYFSGLRSASMDALRYVLDYCRKKDIAALFTSQYCDIAGDYYRTHMIREAGGWKVINGGALRTVRFNGNVRPDMSLSKGVLGYIHLAGQTYVHLDGSSERTIALSDAEKLEPHLRQSTFIVDSGDFSADAVKLTCRGFGKAYFSLAGLQAGKRFSATLCGEDGKAVFSRSVQADDGGVAEVRLSLDGPPRSYTLTMTQEGR